MKSSMVHLAALAVAVVCSASWAQDAGAAAPASPPAAGPDTPKAAAPDLKTACKDDIARLCPRVKPGAGRLAACLSGAKDKLSEGCKAAVEASVAAVKKFDEDCKADLQTHCRKVPVGKGRRVACLKGARDKLQPACKAYFEAGGTPVDADAQD